MNTPRPPRLSAWLLGRLVDPSDRDAVLGDLAGEMRQRTAGEGARRARAWYRRQALRSLWPVIARRCLDTSDASASRLPAATFAAVAGVIVGVALVATLVPAWRALKVEPVVALQSE